MSRTAQLTEQLSLSLPYEIIDKLAVRDTIRARKEIIRGGRESYKIPFAAIEIRQNFNTRYEYAGIEELALSIVEQGLLDPIYVDVLENGKIFIERGHRRYLALKHIIDNNLQKEGSDFTLVECFINKSSMTEQDRILNLFGTNMHSKELTPLEQAEAAYRLKHCLGSELSNEEVASKLSVSRQTVDNLITVSSAPDSLKTQIKSGDITFTAALALIKSEKKLKKAAEKEEEKQAQTGMYEQPGYQDPLKDEMEELKQTELQADRYKQQEAERERKEAERLERDAVLVPVTVEAMSEHLGKRLASDAMRSWKDDFADPEQNNEIVSITRYEPIIKQGQLIDEPTIEELLHNKIENVYIYKEVQAAPSVITEPVAEPEKNKYDLSRPEMESITKAIQNVDKIEAIINKLDVPQGTKDDISYLVHWTQKNMADTREWVHLHKTQNKRGS